jgi:hypothetical protein
MYGLAVTHFLYGLCYSDCVLSHSIAGFECSQNRDRINIRSNLQHSWFQIPPGIVS